MHFAQLKTLGGYLNSECTSAMQKCIRRGLEEEALFWATELDLAGYGAYVWKRLRIVASEDIGLADPNLCVQVRVLYENWIEQRKKKEDRSAAERLFLVQAVLLCVRAKKSRMVDTALITIYEGERPRLEIPDFALDMHTSRDGGWTAASTTSSMREPSVRTRCSSKARAPGALIPTSFGRENNSSALCSQHQ